MAGISCLDWALLEDQERGANTGYEILKGHGAVEELQNALNSCGDHDSCFSVVCRMDLFESVEDDSCKQHIGKEIALLLFDKRSELWKLSVLATKCPRVVSSLIFDTLARRVVEDSSDSFLVALEVGTAVLQFIAERRPEDLQEAILGAAEAVLWAQPGAQPEEAADLDLRQALCALTCAALCPAVAEAIGRPVLRSLNRIVCEEPASLCPQQSTPWVWPSPRQRWIEEAAEGLRLPLPPGGVAAEWAALLLLRSAHTLGAEAPLLLDSLIRGNRFPGGCRAMLSFLSDLVALSATGALDKLARQESAGVCGSLPQKLGAFRHSLEMRVEDLARQAATPGGGPLLPLLALLCHAGIATTGCKALAVLSAGDPTSQGHALALAEMLCSGGAVSEVRLWVERGIERTRSPSMCIGRAKFCSLLASAALRTGVLRTAVHDCLQCHWGTLAKILAHLGEIHEHDYQDRVLSLLEKVAAPSGGWRHVRGCAASLFAFILESMRSDDPNLSLIRVERATRLLAQLCCASEAAFERVCDLALDAVVMLESGIYNGAGCCRGTRLSSPALLLSRDGQFWAVLSRRWGIDNSRAFMAERPEEASKEHLPRLEAEPRLLSEGISMEWACKPLLKPTGSGGGSAERKQEFSTRFPRLSLGWILASRAQFFSSYLVEILVRCVEWSPGSHAVACGDGVPPSDRAALLSACIQRRLDDSFGPPPGLAAYEEALPNAPSMPWHVKTVELLKLCPEFLDLLEAVVQHGASSAIEPCMPIVRAALAQLVATSAFHPKGKALSVEETACKITWILWASGRCSGYLMAATSMLHVLPEDDISIFLMTVWQDMKYLMYGESVSGAIGHVIREGQGTIKALLHKHCLLVAPIYRQITEKMA
mmetsp:Transcript_33395/g.79173  ORF Transcript_33395/g.79173 Transcript_33395/m.79173 type:complete len:881 (-) Transcript_33395:133-2775(-)